MAKLYLYSQKYSILSIIVSNLPGKFTPAIIGVIVKFQEVSQFHEDSCSLQGTLEACSRVRLTMRTSVMDFQRSASFVGGNAPCGSWPGNSLSSTSLSLSQFLCSTGEYLRVIS